MRNKHAGFTLIEVLVATVISAGMLTLVMTSFWTLWQTYRTADLMREMQHESTFAMARIADKIRAEGLDYSAYNSPTQCAPNQNRLLCVGSGTFFRFDAAEKMLFMGNYDVQNPLFSASKFIITGLQFDRYPTNEPTRTDIRTQFQPQVGVRFKIASRRDIWGREIDPSEGFSLDLQTTISSRQYDF